MTKKELMEYQQMHENMKKNYYNAEGEKNKAENSKYYMNQQPLSKSPMPMSPSRGRYTSAPMPKIPSTKQYTSYPIPKMPSTEQYIKLPTPPSASESDEETTSAESTSESAQEISSSESAQETSPITLPEELTKKFPIPKLPPEWKIPFPMPVTEETEVTQEPETTEQPAIPETSWEPVKPSDGCIGACLPYAYPPIEVKEPNDSYACIIYSLFAGKVSALTSFLRYHYDSVTFMEENKEAYEIFSDISKCEMHHLDILSKILVKLGSLPKYQTCEKGQFTWWNAGPANMIYPTYLKMAVLEDLDMEKKMIEAYNEAIKTIDDPYIATILRRIVMDDEYHIKLLSELFNRCCI